MTKNTHFKMDVAPYNPRRPLPWPNVGGVLNRVAPIFRPFVQEQMRTFQRRFRERMQANRDRPVLRAKRNTKVASMEPIVGVISNNNAGSVKVSKKGGKKRKAPPKFSKREKLSIKKIVNSADFEKISDWQKEDMFQITSSVNEVDYFNLLSDSISTWLSYLQNQQITQATDGVSTVITSDPKDLLNVQGANKKYKIKVNIQMVLKNNTSGPADMIIYHGKCKELTDVDMEEDLNARINREFQTGILGNATLSAAPSKEFMFFQKWSTKSMKDCHWDLVKKTEFRLNPGDEYKYFANHTFYIDLRTFNVADSGSYMRGFPCFLVRTVGVPTHDGTTPTVGQTGISNTRVDVVRRRIITSWCKDNDTLDNRNVIARTGFNTITAPVAVADDNVAPVDAI